jgi:undecaprenyl-diphosphatase
MEQMLQAILLGLIQGITELLPISSTAHVLLFEKILSFTVIEGRTFSALIQVGSAFAIFCRLFSHIRTMAKGLYQKERIERTPLGVFTIALFPAVFCGLFFHSFIKTHFYSTESMALSLMIGGVLFLLLDPISHSLRSEKISYKEGFLIGLFQIFAFIPGASRLGSTLIGGTIAGVSRQSLLTFSFLLAIPILLGAGVHDLLRIQDSLNLNSIGILALGFIAAFGGTYSLFPIMFRFLMKNGLFLMGWYRIALGALFFLL